MKSTIAWLALALLLAVVVRGNSSNLEVGIGISPAHAKSVALLKRLHSEN